MSDWQTLFSHCYTCTYCAYIHVEKLCREPHEIPGKVRVTNEQGEPISSLRLRRSVSDISETQGHCASERAAAFNPPNSVPLPTISETPRSRKPQIRSRSSHTKTDPSLALSNKQGMSQACGRLATIVRRSLIKQSLESAMNTPKSLSFSESMDYLKLSVTSNTNCNAFESPDAQLEFETLQQPDKVTPTEPRTDKEEELTAGVSDEGSRHLGYFRPLLLFIPLRLGQDSFNMEYAEALKVKIVSWLMGVWFEILNFR